MMQKRLNSSKKRWSVIETLWLAAQSFGRSFASLLESKNGTLFRLAHLKIDHAVLITDHKGQHDRPFENASH